MIDTSGVVAIIEQRRADGGCRSFDASWWLGESLERGCYISVYGLGDGVLRWIRLSQLAHGTRGFTTQTTPADATHEPDLSTVFEPIDEAFTHSDRPSVH